MYAPNYQPLVGPESPGHTSKERRIREANRRAAYGECARGTCDGAARFRVSTWLSPRERQQVDAGALECVRTVHRDSLAEVRADLAGGEIDGAVVSAARIGREHVPTVSALVQGFPAQMVVGLIGDVPEQAAITASLLFGQAGVRALADVRTAQGWREFRNVFDCVRQPDQFIRKALAVVLCDIGEGATVSGDGRGEFFRLVFSPRVTSAKELARYLTVKPSTLMSRFFRAGLPSPKKYVAYARLVWAAHWGETPALSIASIADRLNASSPQSFHRTLRALMGMSAVEFRGSFNGLRMFQHFRSLLVTPYVENWRTFDPLADSVGVIRSRQVPASEPAATKAEQGRAA